MTTSVENSGRQKEASSVHKNTQQFIGEHLILESIQRIIDRIESRAFITSFTINKNYLIVPFPGVFGKNILGVTNYEHTEP